MRTVLLALLLLVFPFVGSAPAFAAEGAPTATVRKANTTLRELLRKKAPAGSEQEKQLAREVTAKLASFLDIDELGRRALRDHWAGLSEAERKEFTTLLRELVEASYLRALRSQLDFDVRYVRETKKDGSVQVDTEVKARQSGGKQAISIDYVLHEAGGTWRVFDLVTDGVGLVENYRSQFNKVIAKEGFPGLLARMRKKRGDGG